MHNAYSVIKRNLFFYQTFQLQDVVACKEVVNHLADNKQVCMFKLLKRKWSILREMLYIMSIPYKATVSLQKQSLTLSDVFGIWLEMQLHLNACSKRTNYKSNLAKHLTSTLSERKEVIFKNPFMASALFLDPRFRSQIVRDEQKVDQAKETLKSIWRRLLALSVTEMHNTEERDHVIRPIMYPLVQTTSVLNSTQKGSFRSISPEKVRINRSQQKLTLNICWNRSSQLQCKQKNIFCNIGKREKENTKNCICSR